MKIKVAVPQPIMSVKEVSQLDASYHKRSDYNPLAWRKRVNDYMRYRDVVYLDAGDKLFVVYTISEGIRFIREVEYASSLHNGGFNRVYINEGKVTCERPLANHPDSCIANTKEGRAYMAHWSGEIGAIWTNDLPLSNIIEEEQEIPDEFYEQFMAKVN